MNPIAMFVVLLSALHKGGAATASQRICAALNESGIDARMVYRRHGEMARDRLERWALQVMRRLDKLPLAFYDDRRGAFSVNWMPDRIDNRIAQLDPDIVHLNWMGGGWMNVRTLPQVDEPIVWRLPDMWPFTGGCHYAGDCDRFTKQCGRCPNLASDREGDVSNWTWMRKKKAWVEVDLTVVAPSQWLAEEARRSSLLGDKDIRVIPNCLDTDVFRPRERVPRALDSLPVDSRIVLFGAPNAVNNPRKGADLLFEAMNYLPESENLGDIHLVVFGADEPAGPTDLPFPTTYTGFIGDEERLSRLYAAADVMVVPSRYEGFGQTNSEALACGTPVVAFDATGPKDIVDHKETGYLAEPYDARDLAQGIVWVLEDEDRLKELSTTARQRAEERFDFEVVARQYIELYSSLLG